MSLPARPFPAVAAADGVTRQVLADSPELMIVANDFAAGACGALHHHPHLQATFVQSGRFTFTVAGETFEVGPGDCFIVPPDADHGCECREAGRLIDSFTPRRDDFLVEQ
jgi:quercetin dioxygenase-like cupin family protein